MPRLERQAAGQHLLARSPSRTRLLDLGAMAAATLMVVLWFLDPLPEPSYAGPAYFGISYGLGAAGVIAIWWRRHWASPLACLLIVGSVVLPVLSGPSLVALFTVAGYRRPGTTLWMTGLALLSAPLQVIVGAPLDNDDFWRGVIPLYLVSLLVVGWGMALRSRRELVDSLRERARQLARERDLVADRARRAEREEIARDMHDSLAHRLSLISLSAGALHYRREGIPAELADLAVTLQENSKAALTELRSAVGGIRARDHLDTRPLDDPLEQLRALIEQSRAAGQEVHSRLELDRGMSARLAGITYRTAQELLTNARKHRPHSAVELTIIGAPDSGVRIRSTNDLEHDGMGEADGGFGLLGMEERVKVHGGRLTAGRTAGHRFEVDTWLPWCGT